MKPKEGISWGPQAIPNRAHIASAEAGQLISSAELHMLLSPPLSLYGSSAIARGFKYRNIFLLACVLWFVACLLLFPEVVYQVLNFTPTAETFEPYLQKRGWLYVFWMFLYSWSYVKDWHFERVALVCLASEVTIFCMDYLTVFSYIAEPMSPTLTLFVLLRLAFITCLLVNAMNAHQAPPGPRSL
ncbi:MAG: hypothetical protein Q7U05_15775 [Polaromonas sp.]|nr:hypothetical protein [Polaromonas sp.]